MNPLRPNPWSIVLAVLLHFAVAPSVRGAEYFPPPDAEGGWRTCKTPAEVRDLAGLDPARLDQAFDFTQRCSQNGGLVVVRHGYLAYERYFGRAHRNANPDMASTGKAFT
ncbi:MAG TPA: hypothetical protein VF796_24895, partial [Humisphaera sp.]